MEHSHRKAAAMPTMPLTLSVVTLLPLVTQRQDDHHFGRFVVLIQRHVTGLTTRDHQLTQALLHGPTDFGVLLKYGKRTRDQGYRPCGLSRKLGQQEIHKPIEIVSGLRRHNPSRHLARANIDSMRIGFGRTALSPRVRALR